VKCYIHFFCIGRGGVGPAPSVALVVDTITVTATVSGNGVGRVTSDVTLYLFCYGKSWSHMTRWTEIGRC